jgi:hypothetical protein
VDKYDIKWFVLKYFYIRNKYLLFSFDIKHNLTKYYPFSEMFRDQLFHYRYSPARNLDGKIWLKFKIDFTYISDDDYFFYIFYPPKSIELKKLQKFLENENAFASEVEYGIILVKVPKENKR